MNFNFFCSLLPDSSYFKFIFELLILSSSNFKYVQIIFKLSNSFSSVSQIKGKLLILIVLIVKKDNIEHVSLNSTKPKGNSITILTFSGIINIFSLYLKL